MIRAWRIRTSTTLSRSIPIGRSLRPTRLAVFGLPGEILQTLSKPKPVQPRLELINCNCPNTMNKNAQTATELAVFGSVLVFLIGLIVQQAMGINHLQNQSLRSVRMA